MPAIAAVHAKAAPSSCTASWPSCWHATSLVSVAHVSVQLDFRAPSNCQSNCNFNTGCCTACRPAGHLHAIAVATKHLPMSARFDKLMTESSTKWPTLGVTRLCAATFLFTGYGSDTHRIRQWRSQDTAMILTGHGAGSRDEVVPARIHQHIVSVSKPIQTQTTVAQLPQNKQARLHCHCMSDPGRAQADRLGLVSHSKVATLKFSGNKHTAHQHRLPLAMMGNSK
jgi:hypothetical protein